MAFDAYIQIDGIPGEVLDAKHKDWIEVLGYEYGATRPPRLPPAPRAVRRPSVLP